MKAKQLLPFDSYTLYTRLNPTEVKAKINSVIKPKGAVYSAAYADQQENWAYEGSVKGDSFEIKRIINYRNSFLPIIKGSIRGSMNLTAVSIRMRPLFSCWLLSGFGWVSLELYVRLCLLFSLPILRRLLIKG